MNRIISVITAVDPQRSEHLTDTWESLVSQRLPEEWEFEWLVQCDGTEVASRETVRAFLPADQRISFSASRKGGPGIARTMALARAKGSLIKTLDADDRLTSGALDRDIAALSLHSEVGWSASRVVDDRNGERVPHYPYDPPHGIIRSGLVYRAYVKENYRILVHPATLCVRYPLLVALGGWMALPASEDTGLLMALDAVTHGYFIADTGMIYRRWAPQMSAGPEHVDTDELTARRDLIIARAEALSYLIDS